MRGRATTVVIVTAILLSAVIAPAFAGPTGDVPDAATVVLSDADNDGLSNEQEQRLGTDPTDPDTDNDGLSDGVEVKEPAPITDADPLRKDVFVEVDYTDSVDTSILSFDPVVEAFAEAPVDNPDGTRGITLHIVVDEQVAADDYLTAEEYYDQQADYHSYSEQGFYHLLVVEQTLGSYGQEYRGFAFETTGGAAMSASEVDSLGRERAPNAVMMHELGHLLGLNDEDFDGIDTTEYSTTTYSSVMNYNYGTECRIEGEPCPDGLSYSSSEPFSGWSHVEDQQSPPATQMLDRGVRGPIPHISEPDVLHNLFQTSTNSTG